MVVVRAGVVAGVVLLALAGCTSAEETPDTAAPTDTAAVTPAPSATPTGAAGEKPAFDAAIETLLDEKAKPTGRQFVDALVDAGFDKSLMEVTADKTSIGLVADAIEFSVKFDDECIVGQKGAEFGYSSVVLPVLDSGTCLVGKTRDIDW